MMKCSLDRSRLSAGVGQAKACATQVRNGVLLAALLTSVLRAQDPAIVVRVLDNSHMETLMRFWEGGFHGFHPNVTFENKYLGTANAIAGLHLEIADIALMGREILPNEDIAYRRVFKTSPLGVAVATASFNVLGGSHKWDCDLHEYANAYAPDGTLIANAGDLIVKAVESGPGAIGFCGFGHATAGVRALPLSDHDGPYVPLTRDNVENRSYPLTRTVYMFVNEVDDQERNPRD